MKRLLSLLVLCALAIPVVAQTAPASSTLPTNVYAAGVSFNSSVSPRVAGTGLYARLVNDGSGTYAFTVVDAVPASTNPLTVSTNFGVGVAQKLFTVGKIPILIPTSAGVSYNGSATGWAWSTGALASIKFKGSWRVFPNLRIVKSSVSNGSGYQPIAGVLVGWGQ